MSLKLFRKDGSLSRDNAVPTVRLKDGIEGHLIEEILDHRFTADGLDEYKCKWVGVSDDITWEPATNLQSVPGLIKQFLRKTNGMNPRGSSRLRGQQHGANFVGSAIQRGTPELLINSFASAESQSELSSGEVVSPDW
ncbi:hypothetical protein PF011_g25446 [Phytophthora fragariae]|uniref:Chromo domain-containing protein n=1 Tax=Phytophthora fragariae TaxID=53985 RepID=A0A6A3HVC6_9STRA|nr:hypothetical protein PF011_g25446 [Phytophthora fragariae]